MKRAYLSFVLILLMVCSVSAFSFQDVFAGSLADMVTGKSSIMNSYPDTNLNMPTNSQVLSGTKIKVAWSYFDEDGDKQQAYLIQFSHDFTFDDPLNLGGMGDSTSAIFDVRKGGDYYVRVKTKDAYGWGEWSETRRIFVDAESKSCSDGTAYWQCSGAAPAYCDGGVLIDNCVKCGCPANQKCVVTSGVCVRQTCMDGIEYGFCSTKKPKYCMNGELVEVCSLCGCPEGMICLADGTCTLQTVGVLETGESASILERIAGFFKGVFGGLFK